MKQIEDMGTMRYKPSDKVRIKSLDWYNKHKNRQGDINYGCETEILFTSEMSSFCGQVVTITRVRYIGGVRFYHLAEDKEVHLWVDGMFEGLVEEETLIERVDDNGLPFNEWLSHKGAFHIPDGYVLKDENGNVINATKIVLEKVTTLKTQSNMETETHKEYYITEEQKEEIMEEKRDKAKAPNLIGEDYSGKRIGYKIPNGYEFDKIENGNIIFKPIKPKYPKTYEECCKVMNYCCNPVATKTTHKEELIRKFQFLLLYRDAYWKIAGEEMGLGKPWKPDWSDDSLKPCIGTASNEIIKCTSYSDNAILTFPTEEMRDAFYENFKELIETCKELL